MSGGYLRFRRTSSHRIRATFQLVTLTASRRQRKLLGRYRPMWVEVRQHMLRHQPQRLHDVLMRDTAGLLEANHLAQPGPLELLELAIDLVGIADDDHVMLLQLSVGS